MMRYGAWAVWFGAGLVVELAAPGLRMERLAFPVNALVLSAMTCAVVALELLWPRSACARALRSGRSSLIIICVAALTCLCMGLTGLPAPRSWWMAFVMTALMANLLAVTVSGLRSGRPHRLRFILNHAGLLLALAAGCLGSADDARWRLLVSEDVAVSRAYSPDGFLRLPSELRLVSFDPERMEAVVDAGGRRDSVSVNSPLALSATDDLFLIDYDRRGCIFEVVRRPWKYVMWCGLWMMMAGALLLMAQGVGRVSRKGVAP